MTGLDALIAAVAAGAFDADTERNIPRFNAFADAFEVALGMKPSYSDGWGAYRGSLDAAHRLHEALLPGWGWEINFRSARLESPDGVVVYGQRVPGPQSRLWLLAILRALQAQGGDK